MRFAWAELSLECARERAILLTDDTSDRTRRTIVELLPARAIGARAYERAYERTYFGAKLKLKLSSRDAIALRVRAHWLRMRTSANFRRGHN